MDVEGLLRRTERMASQRSPAESVWRKCFDVTFPERSDGLGGSTIDAQSAQTKKADLMDSTGTDAARMLASSVVSDMTPANNVWFALDVGDELDDERRWLDHVAKACWENIHSANYDSAKFDCVLDSVVAGWFVLFIDQDRERGGLHFEGWPLAQCYIASSRAGGLIDIVHRCYKLTAEQAVSEFGDRCSDAIQDAARKKPDQLFEFVRIIEPRTTRLVGSRLARNLPIASIHIERAQKRVVRESGFHEMPAIVARWLQLPNSPYAVGPVSAALPTINALNELLRMEAVAVARAAAGVYVAEDDGVLNARTVKVKGGTVIVANSVDSIKPLPTGADFNVTFSKAETMRAEIRRLLMADQLPPVDAPTKTATEFYMRAQMVRRIMGPVYGRFQSEDLAPTIDRVFGILYRVGRPELGGQPGPVLIADPPESLANRVFTVRYQSPLARSQKLDEVAATERLLSSAGAIAAAGMPEALDLVDAAEAMRAMGEGLGVPEKVLRADKDVAALRQARAQQQQAQAQAAQAQQINTMAADAMFKRAANA